jgi:hypothetical protein
MDIVPSNWTKRIEKMLDMIRVNCSILGDYHSYKYQRYKKMLTYFRVPLIVLSAFNAFAAIGLQQYTSQRNISTINGTISLFCGILTSVELFLNVQKKMELELSTYKDYNILSVQIFKVISIDRSQRKIDGREFLDSIFMEYEKLIQTSNAITHESINDMFSQSASLKKKIDRSHIKKIMGVPNKLYSAVYSVYNPKLHKIKSKQNNAMKYYECFFMDPSGNDMENTYIESDFF